MNQKSKLALSTALIAFTFQYYCYELVSHFLNLEGLSQGLFFLSQLSVIITLSIILSAILTLGLNFILARKMDKDWDSIGSTTILGLTLFVVISCFPFTYAGFLIFMVWVPTILSVWIGIVLFLLHTQQVMDYKETR